MARKKLNISGILQGFGGATAGGFVANKLSALIPISDQRISAAIPGVAGALLTQKAKGELPKAMGYGMMAVAGQNLLAGFGINGFYSDPMIGGILDAEEIYTGDGGSMSDEADY